MTVARSALTTTTWLSALSVVAIGSCTLDLSLKHRCETASDCEPGRACVRHVCQAAATGQRPNIMFVTSRRYPPRFQPLEDADAKCNDAADAAGLPGDYRAWLSTAAIYARDRLAGARGWVRTDGAPFADTVDDLVAGRIFNPPMFDEFGHEVRSGDTDVVATGTDPTGYNSPGNTCNEWANDQAGNVLYGTTDGTTGVWTSFFISSCGTPMRLYCFGVDQVFAVTPAETAGKIAFVSDALFTPVGGREAADAACAREADAAGIERTFWALLPTDEEWAAARFPDAGVPWVRLDRIPISATGSDLFEGRLRAPLNVTSRGRYLGIMDFAFGGASTPLDFPMSSDCANWNDPTANSFTGSPNFVTAFWFYNFQMACGPSHLYCLEH